MTTLLVTEVFPPRTGGSGRWFWEVYRRLERNQTTIVAGAYPGDDAFDSSHDLIVRRAPLSFPTWGVCNREGWGAYRSLVRTLRDVVEARGVRQIHCGKVLPEGLAAWWLCHRLAIPYLCYVHGEELNVVNGSRELRFLTRRVFGSAHRVIANSENTADLLRRDWQVKEPKLCVLHPGVDTVRYCPVARDDGARKRLGWDNRPVVLTVSRLQKRKGHDQLIRAIPSLLPKFPDLLYSVVGDGPEGKSLHDLVADLGMQQHVEFRGEVTDDEMLACYQQCDLFALPNRTVDGDFEGFGMVLLEAQACGKPVLAGASGGTSEAMQDGQTGILADCTSVPAIAATVTDLLSDRERAKSMGEAGRKWTVSNFSWDSLVKQAQSTFCWSGHFISIETETPFSVEPAQNRRGCE